ncbi:hypothetical protein [Phenylobacterium kunshanense]|uniref:YARHG domain-containing protein n=1 Tax=Phenylobacterium kunshanense TaxID=1445034 RepID=A0A328BGD2_9CAUL|nr:hypothetical protein [Phenylobacterium kunshanense]RAK66562.1 hypothetical protein DJ019_10005 [Phenylobacterium kunshanense]
MRLFICTIVASALTAGVALAEQAPAAADAARDSVVAPSRTVYVCNKDTLTRRGFSREHGAVEFVKAEAVLAKGESWSAPKCVTSSEARRLKQLASLKR